jgi:hypothetical protein
MVQRPPDDSDRSRFPFLRDEARPVLELREDVPFDEWVSVGHDLCRIHRNVQWCIGDWWRYGLRAYGEAQAQAALSGYALKTCKNAARVAKSFSEPSRRRASLPWGHHEVVAALPATQQDELLDLAEKDGLPIKELRQMVRRVSRDENIGGVRTEADDHTVMHKYAVLLADPPWTCEQGEPMSLKDICGLKVPAANDAVLGLWSPSARLDEAMDVVAAWGFTYSTNMTWVKPSAGSGYYVKDRRTPTLGDAWLHSRPR